jgi:diadenosine tetraphosphate (Ap4A) HIT family hydrolase
MSHGFQRLREFVTEQMRMSHVYQPVMLRRLLLGGGVATKTQIAADILSHDPTQVEYYERVVVNMVGRVLTSKNDLVVRDGQNYELPLAMSLSMDQTAELISLCEDKISEYQERQGQRMWEHRRHQGRIISGTVRYEVLKRAKYRCELCGVSADVKALEVDHILPRSHGGKDDISNLQALCYSCNASKRDRDATDFRGIAASYSDREEGCLFCQLTPDRVIEENALAVAIRDGFPVTNSHTLILPKRHIPDYFDLRQPELNAVNQLIRSQRLQIMRRDQSVTAFNIGANCGSDAGQTIPHCHIHLIPRRQGDVPQPRGGVRHIIPGKGDYQANN